jgi:hypothetical protein
LKKCPNAHPPSVALVSRSVPVTFTFYNYFNYLASLCPTNTKWLMVMKCILLPSQGLN